MPSFIDKDGTRQEATLQPTIYKQAAMAGLSVPQLINRTYATHSGEALSTFEQMCASEGLIVASNKEFGIRPPTIGALLDGNASLSAASNVIDGNPASRLLYPAVVLEMVESAIAQDRTTDPGLFDQMVGMETSITSSRYEWPVINLSRAEGARKKAISQLAEPEMMLTVTSADSSKSLLTQSIGLEVSDQALQATTMDFVSMALRRQGEVERNLQTYEYLLAFLNGDADMSQSALSQTKANSLDATITAAGAVTKTALVKWLVTNYYKRRINWVVTDIAGALAIEAALATTNTNQFVPGALVPQFSLVNRMLESLKLFIVEGGMNWPANTLMGLDSKNAIHRVRNSAASYSAVEAFVMRRSTQLRFDSAEIAYRLWDDAFDVLSLTLT